MKYPAQRRFRLTYLWLLLFIFAGKAWAQDPVAFWKMDESGWNGSSGEVIDSSGNGNHGRARTAGGSNSLPDTEEAKVCRGGRFRGQGFNESNGNYIDAQHFVEVPDSNELSPLATTQLMSISGWVRLEERNGTQTLIHKGAGNRTQEYNLSFDNGRLELTLWNRYGSGTSHRLSERVSAGQWYFFWSQAARYNNGTAGMQVTLFDESGDTVGSQVRYEQNFFDGSYVNKPLNSAVVLGGTRYDSGNPVAFLKGTLDEVYVHDTLLSSDEVQALAGNTRDCLSPDPLTCFDDQYSAGNLSEDWVTSVSRGSFTPQVINGRLRMTQAQSNQATAATVQKKIPAAENLVILEFDYYAYGGNGADGLAFVLSDATVTPQPGSYGGSLGYAQRSNGDPGFAGGWIGIGLDEYGNFSNANEGRVGGPGFRRDAVAIRGAAPNYRYLEGTGTLSPGIDSPNDNNPSAQRYRIIVDSQVDGQALISVERDISGTGNNYQTLIAPFNALTKPNQPAVPEHFLLSMTGSTGGSNNIHEFDNFSLCALKLEDVGAQVDHFEIEHDGVGLTCQAEEQITIRACANADCSQQFTDPVDATMSPSGWVGGDTITVTGGETTAALRKTTPGTVRLGVLGSSPSTRPQAVTLCRVGNGGLSSANCNLRFYETGLVFDVPDMVANEEETGIQVQAVRTEGSPPQACVPAFANVTRDVNFWSGYVNPNDSGISATTPVFVDGDAISGSSASPTSVPLSFNGSGIAEIDVNYADAGRMQLNAAYEGSAATNDQDLEMPGADQFVSRPYGFCIEATSPNAACSSPFAGCSVLAAAGDLFDLRIRAVASESGGNGNLCSGNAVTRNFRATLDLDHSLVAPSDGVKGVLGEAEVIFAQADDGDVTLEQSVSEVGVFRFGVPDGQPYLGTALSEAESADTGRFIPARFQINTGAADPGALKAGCEIGGDDFHYIGQPMTWSVAPSVPVVALNADGVVTENYTRGDFLKLTASDVQRTFPSADTMQTTVDSASLLPAEAEDKTGSLQVDNTTNPGLVDYLFSGDDLFWYPKTRQARVAPFVPSLELEITSITDSDGVQLPSPHTFIAGLAMDSDTGNTFDVRYGRLAMENVYGPENLDELSMPARLESWNGTDWVGHDAGSCTPGLSAVSNTANYSALDTSSITFGSAPGEILLRLVPNGTEGTDTLEWGLSSGIGSSQPPEANDWLMDFWGREPDTNALQNPQGLATFGVYRGNDRIIYWREVPN